MITISHVKDAPAGAIYVGRKMPKFYRAGIASELLGAINAGSALGNPWRPEDGDPIGKYRAWLWRKLQAGNRLVRYELDKIVAAYKRGDITLACWCADMPRKPYEMPQVRPDGCHADVVASCVVWLATNVVAEAIEV